MESTHRRIGPATRGNSALVFRPALRAKGDGYNVFKPESERFADHHLGLIFEIEAQKMIGTTPVSEQREEKLRRRTVVLEAIAKNGPVGSLTFFCHGWRTGMQLGFDVQSAPELARALKAAGAPPNVVVALYACSCGDGAREGDGGFADTLRDALGAEGLTSCRVDAHSTVGHATYNPYVRRFECQGSEGGTGGQWIVAPGSKLWPQWRAELRRSDLRLLYPFMKTSEIHEALCAPNTLH